MALKFGLTQIMFSLSALNAVSAELGPVEMNNIDEITYYVVFEGTVSAGAVQLESSHVSGYSGTWSPEGSPVAFSPNSVKMVQIVGITQIRRARISSPIIGGTVSVFALGRASS